MKDVPTARAVQRALVSSPDWWSAVASLVILTLDDSEGGFAFTDQKTISHVGHDGEVHRSKFPRYPRANGRDDYIYNWRTLGERALSDRAPKPTRLELVRRRHAEMLEQRRFRDARIRIDTNGYFIDTLVRSLSAPPRALQLVIAPDTAEIRAHVQKLLDPPPRVPNQEPRNQRSEDPFRHLQLVVMRANCRVTGLLRGGAWEDPSGLEAARIVLQERFDLRIGLWDLALNPVLRSTVLQPSPIAQAPSSAIEAPARARRRAELRAGGVERQLHARLAQVGWQLTRLDRGMLFPTGLFHPVVEGASKHPYLLVVVKRHEVSVFAWHWHYMTFDINAFVDARLDAFDAVSALPPRKPLRAEVARKLGRQRKQGPVLYQSGRLLDDPRSVPLWSSRKGWEDIDTDWSNVAAEIAERTAGWVKLLADAIAECLGVDRQKLILAEGG